VTDEPGLREYEAVRRLARQPRLLRQFIDPDTSKDAEETLGLTPDFAKRVKEILAGVQLQNLDEHVELSPTSGTNGDSQGASAVRHESDSATEFLNSSFAQLRNAYVTLLAMSVVTFVIGVGFLIIAAIQSIDGSHDPAEVAVIGGIGIIQLVTLFLRNPLHDIERATSKAQQSRIAIMGYMLAVGLVGESVYGQVAVAPDVDRLDRLTDSAITRLKTSDAGRESPSEVDASQRPPEGTGTSSP
jgi:hypothetical protein